MAIGCPKIPESELNRYDVEGGCVKCHKRAWKNGQIKKCLLPRGESFITLRIS